MDGQTLIVLTVVAGAVLYVGRSLWPFRRTPSGCGSCPKNRNRTDDYV